MKAVALFAMFIVLVFQGAISFYGDPIQPEPLKVDRDEIPSELVFQTHYIFQLENEVVWYGKCKDWCKAFEGKGFVDERKVFLEGANAETQLIRVPEADFVFPTEFTLTFHEKNYRIHLLARKKVEEAENICFRPSFVKTTIFCRVMYPGAATLPHKTEMALTDLEKIHTFKLGDLEFKAKNLFSISTKEVYFQIMGESEPSIVFPKVVKESILETFDSIGKKLGDIVMGFYNQSFVVTYEWFGELWPEDSYGSSSLSFDWVGVIDGTKGEICTRFENDKIVLRAPFKPATEMIFVADTGRILKIKVTDQIPKGYAKIEKLMKIEK